MNYQQLIETIIDEFGLPESPKSHTIDNADIKNWMRSSNIEVLGVLTSYILEKEYSRRIEPNLTFEEVHRFIMSYYERCLVEDPKGEWVDSDYEAAWSLAKWFNYLWSDKKTYNKEIIEFKSWLGNLYKSSDKRLQKCLINGLLEHIFEDKNIASFFKEWENDIDLAQAYNEGKNWISKQ